MFSSPKLSSDPTVRLGPITVDCQRNASADWRGSIRSILTALISGSDSELSAGFVYQVSAQQLVEPVRVGNKAQGTATMRSRA